MNTQQKIAGTAVLVAGAVFVTVAKARELDKDMAHRFPNIDPKVRRKAYRRFLANSAAGVYGDMDGFHDYKMDQLFLDIVRDMENPLRTK